MNHIPNNESNPFQSLAELILKNESIAILAEAIDKGDIYCWDRFGRFKKADKFYVETALDLLAKQHKWETKNEYPIQEEQNPLEDFMHPLYGFGWAHKVLPKFDEIKNNIHLVERPKSQSAETKISTTYLVVIAALANKLGLEVDFNGKVGRGVSIKIQKIIDEFGLSMSEDTIRNMLNKLQDAINLRQK